MNANNNRPTRKSSGLLNWFSRLRGHGVVGPDGGQGVWMYFDDDDKDEFVNYGYSSSNSTQTSDDYYVQ